MSDFNGASFSEAAFTAPPIIGPVDPNSMNSTDPSQSNLTDPVALGKRPKRDFRDQAEGVTIEDHITKKFKIEAGPTINKEFAEKINQEVLCYYGKLENENFYCVLCYSVLPSIVQLERHTFANEHMRRIGVMAKGKKEGSRFCDICHLSLTEEIHDQHMTGKKHKKALQAFNHGQTLKVTVLGDKLKGLLNKDVIAEGTGGTLGLSKTMRKFESMEGAFIGLRHALEAGKRRESNPSYQCTLCHSIGESSNFMLHFTSATHRINVLREDYPEEYKEAMQSAELITQRSVFANHLLEIATKIEAREGRNVELIQRRIYREPNEPKVDTKPNNQKPPNREPPKSRWENSRPKHDSQNSGKSSHFGQEKTAQARRSSSEHYSSSAESKTDTFKPNYDSWKNTRKSPERSAYYNKFLETSKAKRSDFSTSQSLAASSSAQLAGYNSGITQATGAQLAGYNSGITQATSVDWNHGHPTLQAQGSSSYLSNIAKANDSSSYLSGIAGAQQSYEAIPPINPAGFGHDHSNSSSSKEPPKQPRFRTPSLPRPPPALPTKPDPIKQLGYEATYTGESSYQQPQSSFGQPSTGQFGYGSVVTQKSPEFKTPPPWLNPGFGVPESPTGVAQSQYPRASQQPAARQRPASSSGSDSLMERLVGDRANAIRSEEDAEIAYKVSAALAQALISYRLKNVAKDFESNPASLLALLEALKGKNF